MSTAPDEVASPVKLAWVDQRSLPEWGQAKDGRHVKLEPDDVLVAAYSEWQAGACRHERFIIHKRQDSLGRDIFFRMCKHCAAQVSSAIAHKDVAHIAVNIDPIEKFDNRHKRYESARREALEAIEQAAAERQQPSRRAEYGQHLASDTWKDMRAKVLKRDRGICQGCLDARADEVHHTTYAHIRSEFAFELVSLCSDCHARLHDRAV
jgi:hypothetical protein